jgi:hypothetical protein
MEHEISDGARQGIAKQLRDEVIVFAFMMEEKLKKNDHKGGWHNVPTGQLWHRMHAETGEMDEALVNRATDDVMPVFREAADIANYAMMISDNMGALDEFFTQWLQRGDKE